MTRDDELAAFKATFEHYAPGLNAELSIEEGTNAPGGQFLRTYIVVLPDGRRNEARCVEVDPSGAWVFILAEWAIALTSEAVS